MVVVAYIALYISQCPCIATCPLSTTLLTTLSSFVVVNTESVYSNTRAIATHVQLLCYSNVIHSFTFLHFIQGIIVVSGVYLTHYTLCTLCTLYILHTVLFSVYLSLIHI